MRLEPVSYILEARIDGIQKVLCGTPQAEAGRWEYHIENFLGFAHLECMVRVMDFERLS